MRVVTLILFVILVLLQFKLWLGEGGFREVARLETRVEDQRQQNDDLLQRNAELQAEVEDLRERLEAVEERARNELGLIKPAENFTRWCRHHPVILKPRRMTEKVCEHTTSSCFDSCCRSRNAFRWCHVETIPAGLW